MRAAVASNQWHSQRVQVGWKAGKGRAEAVVVWSVAGTQTLFKLQAALRVAMRKRLSEGGFFKTFAKVSFKLESKLSRFRRVPAERTTVGGKRWLQVRGDVAMRLMRGACGCAGACVGPAPRGSTNFLFYGLDFFTLTK